MKGKKKKEVYAAVIVVLAVLAFNFAVMPRVLAAALDSSGIQTVTGNTTALSESNLVEQEADLNAISKEQAINNAKKALQSLGFDLPYFKNQPIQIQYIEENAPACDPVWAVIFREDWDGYDYVFGADVNDETREKLAAIGIVEACVDENGTTGIRAHSSYTRYTLVEIDALSGDYIRHGTTVATYGEPLNIEETIWAPTTEEAWEQERQRQEQLQQEIDQ